MDSHYVDELIDDDELPELTAPEFASMIPFGQLPVEMQEFLSQVNSGTLQPSPAPLKAEEVTLKLSTPVLARFRATGTGWESRVDEALQQWMEEHQASQG